MQIHRVSKDYRWEAAHRLIHGYPDNCRHLHGHSYNATVTMELLQGRHLNQYGFVYDYNDMKKLKKWINDHFDHACFVSSEDTELIDFLNGQVGRGKHYIFRGQSSAERICEELYRVASQMLGDERARVVEVRVRETCTSEAILKAPLGRD